MADDEDFDNDTEYMVVSVFMTLYDEHYNRLPYPGYLKFEELDSIESNNMPMIFMEKDLFKGKIDFDNSNYDYLFNNSRMVNNIYVPKLDLTYQVVQIADDDVNVILPFSIHQGTYYNQNERFSFIRWGSECTVVLPVEDGLDLEFAQKPLTPVS